MPRSARPKNSELRNGWPVIEAAITERLGAQPSFRRVGWTLALLAVALYVSALGYPRVFGDFAFLGPEQLRAYARALPLVGGSWLANASFGWWAALVGEQWPWHRAFNVGLHAAAVCVAYTLFRRIVAASALGASRIAPGWIAALAAALFALHPIAVYTVAYLSARYALLAGLFALVSLWAAMRALEHGDRLSWLIAPLATAAALGCTPSALGIPLAMSVLVLAMPAGARGQRSAWVTVALAAAVALLYALALASSPAAGTHADYADALAASGSRFLRYLGFWLVPLTPLTAADVPEPAIDIARAWPGWLGIVGVAALTGGCVLALRRGASPAMRCTLVAVGCALALYSVELLWPRLGTPFTLARSYLWMPCLMLLPACLLLRLPARVAWIAASLAMLVFLALAAGRLQTFASHVALWDDAVRRAELTGPRAEDARVYVNRATLHRSEGHALAALADYDKALELQPELVRALRGRAQVYVDEKRYGEALRDLDRILELEPAQAITHADRGLALMQAGRLSEAGHAFDRAIERGAREPRVYLNRGLTRFQLGGLAAAPAALFDIEQALKLDPSYALAYYNRAMVFEQAANAGVRLRDALSPELMRAVAMQNLGRACQLGHQGACERVRKHEAESPGLNEGPIKVTPEMLREQPTVPGR